MTSRPSPVCRLAGPNVSARCVVAVVWCLPILFAACGPNPPAAYSSPVAPSTPSPPRVPTVTLSGTVVEAGVPIQNADVWVSGLQPCTSGCSSRQFAGGNGKTDAAGRYRIDVIRPEDAPATVWAVAHKDGYVQQCVATTTVPTNATLDLTLAATANVSAQKPVAVPGSRSVSGVVFEVTATGRQPVEGVSVGWEGLLDTVLAETRSDAAGRYVLCGLPLERIVGVFASKPGYNLDYVSVAAGTDAVVDIQVTRR